MVFTRVMTSSRAHAIGAAFVAARARDRPPERVTSPNMRAASVAPAPARIGAHRRAQTRASATSKRIVTTFAVNTSAPARERASGSNALLSAIDDLRDRIDGLLPTEAKTAAVRASYTASIGLRFAFFLSQGVLTSRSNDERNVDVGAIASVVARVVLNTDESSSSATAPIVRKTMDGGDMSEEQAQEVSEFLEQHMGAIIDVFKRELEFVENGVYKFPYDMDPSTAPAAQWNPLAVAALTRAHQRDQKVVAERRKEKKGQELRETYMADPKRYPDYYLQNFHYQTDGWLSAKSAQLYDFQVETLFLGSADAMRRRALPYIADFMRNRDASTTKHLDVASGTGRFLSFVRDNHPELQSTALELSPHYLEATRKNNARFNGKGGSLRLVEANAEDMPLADEEFDMVTNVYLFHELPRAVRKTVAKEMARVLKPGGKLFFVDSVQIGDGKENGMEGAFELALDRFPAFNHEPYYKDYAVTNLIELFEEAGLKHEATATAWVSKTMVFSKPFDGQQLEAAATTMTVEAPVAEVVVPEAVVETPAAIVEEPTIAETAEVVEDADDEPPVEGTRKF